MKRYLMVSIGPSWWEYIEFASSAGFRDTSADPKAPQKFGAMNLMLLFEDLNGVGRRRLTQG